MDSSPPTFPSSSHPSGPTEEQVVNSLYRPTMVLERAIRKASLLIGGSILILAAWVLLFVSDAIQLDPATGVMPWLFAIPIFIAGLCATVSGLIR